MSQDYTQGTGRIVGQRYREIRKIGCGSFGSIYLGISNQSNEEVAIKREQVSTKHPQIAYEAKLYRLFQVCIIVYYSSFSLCCLVLILTRAFN